MNILFINSCVREQKSRTLELCNTFLNALPLKEGDHIHELNLSKESILALSLNALEERGRLISENAFDHPLLAYAKQLAQADYIIVGAPYWDLSFPAILKQYIENICVDKVTFQYVDNQSVGMCNAKKQMYISSAGGYIDGIHLGEENFKQVGKMIGLDCWDTFCLEGLDIFGVDVERKMNEAKLELKKLAGNWTYAS